jgi:hypothetical protein
LPDPSIIFEKVIHAGRDRREIKSMNQVLDG